MNEQTKVGDPELTIHTASAIDAVIESQPDTTAEISPCQENTTAGSIAEPLTSLMETAQGVDHNQQMFESIQRASDIIKSSIPVLGLDNTTAAFAKTMQNVGQSTIDICHYTGEIGKSLIEGFAYAANALVKSQAYTAIQGISDSFSQVLSGIAQINLTPMLDMLRSLHLDFDLHGFRNRYTKALYECRWFPYINDDMPLTYIIDISEALVNTREGSKNRMHKLDKIIFDAYNKTTIETIRKSWPATGIPAYQRRIMNEAVASYYRKQYALTAIVLASTWDTIIISKTQEKLSMRDVSIKTAVTSLVQTNNLADLCATFFDEYIRYPCYEPSEIKPDVPGRNGYFHGMLNRYPSRKEALNAIIFTDFLCHLKPIAREDCIHTQSS